VTAISAPTTVTATTCRRVIDHSCRRVSPRVRSVVRSILDARSWRRIACATSTSAVRATTRAKSPSAIASGRMARSIWAAWSFRFATKTLPPVAGYLCTSVSACRSNWKADAPGRRRTYAPSKPL